MDLEQLNGTQVKILRQTILSAFKDAATFDMFLQEEVQKPPLDNFAGGGNYEQQVFQAIRSAQAEGWTADLIGAMQANRQRNTLVRNLPDALRLAATEAPPRAPAGGMTLERIVRGGGFADLKLWAEKMSTIGQATCRIEFPVQQGTVYGTGFLVADDLVLTNYHVVEAQIAKQIDVSTLVCRFDYARDAKGLEDGRKVALAESWLVSHSPYDPADVSGAGTPAADHLDFALLRLGEAAGTHDVGGGARRGAITLRKNSAVPAATAPVFVVQHPEGTPMALAIGIVQDLDAGGIRLRYDADTEPGSSGSGVFDQRLDLVALHHAGDPSAKIRARYNQGIPIGKIVAMLEAKGVAPFWR